MSSTPNKRPKAALITNHGYAGVDIPVGGAPDTGGQNFYVNSLAKALETIGHEVTIFARGGFPFFGSDEIRRGEETLSEHVRYVYIPGGGSEFIRKEDIAVALDEEIAWLDGFIAEEARAAGHAPWEHYDILNTHYWDAAVMGIKLVERWMNRCALEFLAKVLSGRLAPFLERYAGEELHREGLFRELDYHFGRLGLEAAGEKDPQKALEALTGTTERIEPLPKVGLGAADLADAISLGRVLRRVAKVEGNTIDELLGPVERHVWTPHSLGIVKERNFWFKSQDQIRSLKFRERDSHEQVVCARTPLFCSTSPEIWRNCVSYHGVDPDRIFDFPPCIDKEAFHPRERSELDAAYAYLSEQSGVPLEQLENSKIVFETSRMDRTKRKDLLLRSFAQIADKVPQSYLFIGGGPKKSPVFQELEKVHAGLPELAGRAFLLGFIPDEVLDLLFSTADLFVSASEMEGFGMSASQAAGAGVAVICSDLIPFATQYAPEAAVVVPAGDTEGFAAAMRRLLTDDDERAARAAKLLEIAGKLDWKSTAAEFVDWFRLQHSRLFHQK